MAGGKVRVGLATFFTCIALGKEDFTKGFIGRILKQDDCPFLTLLKGKLERVGYPAPRLIIDRQAVDDKLDRKFTTTGFLGNQFAIVQPLDLTLYSYALKASPLQTGQLLTQDRGLCVHKGRQQNCSVLHSFTQDLLDAIIKCPA